jgi:hypothetical protein
MAMHTNPERQNTPNASPEAAPSAVVTQPTKLDLGGQLGPLLAEIGRISETGSAGPSNDGPGSTGGAIQTAGSGSAPVVSIRDQAIANLPAPKVMQKQLEAHIRTEIKKLRKQAKVIARINQPGGAYRLNLLYLRIHHLNALLHELLSSSVEVLKRLFIRVFVDKQTVL